jgi:thioredoxin-related protein
MKTALTCLLACLTILPLRAAESEWTTDFNTALRTAKAEKKMVLMNFTGSDWCGWCIKLKNEVFSKPEFKEYAAKHLVLVELDFPKKKKQTAAEKKNNQSLAQRYKVGGFPTIIVLTSDGKLAGELGYQPGGPKAFIAALDKLKK